MARFIRLKNQKCKVELKTNRKVEGMQATIWLYDDVKRCGHEDVDDVAVKM